MLKRLVNNTPGLFPALALGITAALSVLMVAFRWWYSGKPGFLFIPWNLFLAWIPLCCSLLMTRARGRMAMVALAATWLAFLPNAPYVLTDLIHFRVRDGVPYWFDLMMLITFVWTGTLAGYLSLYLVQLRVRERFGTAVSWFFALGVLLLSSFGIYLGRFQRWNSWDVIADPGALLRDIGHRVLYPFEHPRTYAFTLLMALFLIGAYATLIAFVRMPAGSTSK
jgi:uncharacterized membrane protein